MKRLLLAVAGSLLVIVVALALYLTFGDLGRFRPDVEAAVSKAAGREFRITGEFTPRIFPSPSLVAEGVTLANADWGAPLPMISVGKLSVEASLWSLLVGPIRIKRLELQDVAVLLEENASGARNWSGDAPPPSSAPAATPMGWQGLPAIIELASVGNVTVLWRRAGQADLPSALAELDLRTDERGVMVADGGGQVGTTPFTLHATLSPTHSSPAQIDMEASIADAAIKAHAVLAARQLDVAATVADLSRLAAAFSVEGMPASSLDVAGTLLIGADRYELRDATAKLLGAEARIEGVIPYAADAPLELSLQLTAPDLSALRAGLPQIQLESAANVRVAAQRIDVDPFTLVVGDSDFSGKLAAELGDRVSFVVNGESKLVDLRPFQQAAAERPSADTPAARSSKRKWLFGEEELPFEHLASTSIDAKVSIAEIRSLDTEASNVALALTSDGKAMRFATTLDADGGSIAASADLALADDRADLDVALDARDLRLNLMSGKIDDPKQIPPIGMSAKLRSSGNSPRALASAANGSV